jgi:two-component system, NarL family, response regulator
MPEAKIRVMLVDDHPVVRMGLKAMIDGEDDMTVVAEAASGEDALALHERERPDVTLMDLHLPGMSGAAATAEIRRRDSSAAIIVVTTYDHSEDVFRSIEAGARGYLLKGTFRDGVLEAIRAVHTGQRVIPADVAARLAERTSGQGLTERELEVLAMVAKGLSNREIGTALAIAEDTVKNRLKRIFAKLEVADRAEAIYVAVQRGIIKPERDR